MLHSISQLASPKLASSDSDLDVETLQEAISEEYRFVVEDPLEDFHFHTGRPLARKLHYPEDRWANDPLEAPGNQARGNWSLPTAKLCLLK